MPSQNTIKLLETVKDSNGRVAKDNKGEPLTRPHYYALDANGRPLPMEPEQYGEFVNLGGPGAVAALQAENSPFRIDFGTPDTFEHDVQKMAIDKAMADAENRPDAELHRQIDIDTKLAATPPPMTDQERQALTPKSWDEYWERARRMQQGWDSLGYDTVQVAYETFPVVNGQNATEPMLEVRMRGTTLATYRGPLIVLEKRLAMDLAERARRDDAVRLYEEWQEQKRREVAEAMASTPAARIAAQEAELAELKRRDAEREAELDALHYRLNKVIAGGV
jgi:hypothetical protein